MLVVCKGNWCKSNKIQSWYPADQYPDTLPQNKHTTIPAMHFESKMLDLYTELLRHMKTTNHWCDLFTKQVVHWHISLVPYKGDQPTYYQPWAFSNQVFAWEECWWYCTTAGALFPRVSSLTTEIAIEFIPVHSRLCSKTEKPQMYLKNKTQSFQVWLVTLPTQLKDGKEDVRGAWSWASRLVSRIWDFWPKWPGGAFNN